MRSYGEAHNMKIDLGKSESLKEAVGYFENIMNIQDVLDRFMGELVSAGADRAKELCPVDSGDLRSAIYYELKPRKNGIEGSVICESDYAAFVEFGTGVVGQAFPYPGELDGYKYNVKSEAKDSTGGWVYKGDDGNFHYTHGHIANPFMYQTSKYMEMIAPKIARRITNGE